MQRKQKQDMTSAEILEKLENDYPIVKIFWNIVSCQNLNLFMLMVLPILLAKMENSHDFQSDYYSDGAIK